MSESFSTPYKWSGRLAIGGCSNSRALNSERGNSAERSLPWRTGPALLYVRLRACHPPGPMVERRQHHPRKSEPGGPNQSQRENRKFVFRGKIR